MPYKSNEDLPDSLKDNLPDHAQSIYREAFNNAYEEYDSEETAYRVAWSAVKQTYEKDKDEGWVPKDRSSDNEGDEAESKKYVAPNAAVLDQFNTMEEDYIEEHGKKLPMYRSPNLSPQEILSEDPEADDTEKSVNNKSDCRIFGELTKFEPLSDGSIKVYGIASSPVRDSAGEVVTSGAMSKALCDYAKYPTIREMHRSDKAAGRALEIYLDNENKTQLVAHVVDTDAVKKVKAKVYAGFSIGGRVKKRRFNDPSVIEEIDLIEISLVDRPCNPEAAISLWKRKENMPTELNKAGDAIQEQERWDDGLTKEETPEGKKPASPFDDDGQWYSQTFGSGADSGSAGMPTDENAGTQARRTQANSVVDTSNGGGSGDKGCYFSPAAGADNKVRKRTKEERDTAAALGIAMKGGYYPIEDRDDLAYAIRTYKSTPADKHDEIKAHIIKRSKAVGVKLPEDFGAGAKSEGSNNIHENLSILTRADEALKDSMEALEKLELKSKRGRSTDESIKLAKLYKSMPEDDLAEVLAANEETAKLQHLEKLAKQNVDFEATRTENVELKAKVDELIKGLTTLGERVQKLYDTPVSPRTAGSAFAVTEVTKSEDVRGSSKTITLTDADRERAQKLFKEMSEEDQALLLTKVALGNGRALNVAPVPNPPRSIGGAAGR